MRVAQHFDGYNARRYSKPWIAIITAWPIGSKPTLRFGGWIGNDRDGGEAEIDAQPGDIARWGQADHRGNKTDNLWGIVQDDGTILRCTEPQALQHWTQTQAVKADTTAIEIAPIDKTAIAIEEIPPQQRTIAPDIREIQPTAAHYIQSRAQMDFALVDEYAQMMRDGVEFDPAQGIEDADGTIYIWDGYHRGEAAKHINSMLRVRVQPGTRQDAEWLAFAANKSHGLRRTHADIERIVKNALQHPNAANLPDRELARHCGTDHKTVGNWRKRIAADAEQQRRADAGEQIEIAGAERIYTNEEIEAVITDYISATPYNEQIAILQNVILRTVSGMAYTREIQSHLKTKNYTDNAYYAAAKAVQTRLQQATCETCGTVKERAQMFRQETRWYCSKCFPAIQQQTAAADETATAREIEDIENAIMAKLPQNDLALDAIREVMLDNAAFDRLHKQLPGFPSWLVKQAISAIHKRLSLARTITAHTPTFADGKAHELTDDDTDMQDAIQEAEEMAAELAAMPIEPVEELHMHCMACRLMYPARQLTDRTGLCPTCLNDQLEKMATDNRMMKAVFAVLERKLMTGLATELKRDIYEEIFMPMPEPETQPERVTCDACGKIFPRDRIVEYNGRNLHTDCYYAAMTADMKAQNEAESDDDLTQPDPRERVLYYKAQGLSVRKIADALKTEGITISKSAVDRIIQEQKEAQI